MPVVVVSGAPGTGKSTVAVALGVGLEWPVLSLDTLKETLADVLGLGDEAWSYRLGDAAAELIFRLCPQFPSVVVEGWWRGERRTRAIREFAGAVEVFCHCDPTTAADRMRSRQAILRHPIHRDMINPGLVDAPASITPPATPLMLGAALVDADTDTADTPASVVEAVRAALGS